VKKSCVNLGVYSVCVIIKPVHANRDTGAKAVNYCRAPIPTVVNMESVTTRLGDAVVMMVGLALAVAVLVRFSVFLNVNSNVVICTTRGEFPSLIV